MTENGSVRPRLLRNQMAQIVHIEEILVNILSKLPVKTLVAWKSVSKNWFGLISQPHFAELQLNWSKKNPKYIICPYPDDSDIVTHLYLMEGDGVIDREIPVPAFDNICSPKMSCFLNGLICAVNEDDEDGDVDIRIFNPTTQEIILLPKGSPSLDVPSVGLAFDPENSKWKVFRFFCYSREQGVKYKCEVYASDSAAWRYLSEFRYCPKDESSSPYYPTFVCVAGRTYWLVESEEPGNRNFILSVDMNDNFARIRIPTEVDIWTYLIELEGCLSLVRVNFPGFDPEDSENSNPYVEIWILRNHNESIWHLSTTAEFEVPLEIEEVNSVAAIGEEIFLTMKLVDKSQCYRMVNFVENTWSTVDLGDRFEGCSPVAFPFAESLLRCSGTGGA